MWRIWLLLLVCYPLLFTNLGISWGQDRLTLRILSYNIHHCEGVDGKLDVARIAKIIQQVEPDIVALQEVDRHTRRSQGIDQPAELARMLAMQYVFEKNIDHEGGQYGNAILSRLPILKQQNHRLPSVGGSEQRGVLDVELNTPMGIVRLLATHLDHRQDDRERIESMRTINRLANEQPELPTILAGDLNAVPESNVLKLANEQWSITNSSPLFTIPVKTPTRQIDYVLTFPAGRWETKQTRVLDEPVASDHRPIMAVVDLKRRAFSANHTLWNGFERFDFEVAGKPLMVIRPKLPAVGNPWIWHGEFFGHKPAPDIALLHKGFHIVYASIPNMLGRPEAVQHWNKVYKHLTQYHGLAPKAGLVGLSRGGLYCYNWAIANPDKVACIYGDAPVCDFRSWPGGKGTGPGNAQNWQFVLRLWNFKNDTEALAYSGNPVDNLQPLALAGIPLLHVFGDADEVVPWEENTGLIADRFPKLGGNITLIRKPGVKHHPHGLDDPTPIVDFLSKHSSVPVSMSKTLQWPSSRQRNLDGAIVHTLDTPFQSAPTEIRVLLPDSVSDERRLPVLFVLPVEAGLGTRWGDGLSEIKRLDLHNKFGVICVAPTFSQLPWYADHPTSPDIRQEGYVVEAVLPLLRWYYPEARHDRDGRLLVGFSKSGWGAWSLLLRHPNLFGRAAAWDAPLAMSEPGQFGSGPIFGSAENFRHYHIHQLLRDQQELLSEPSGENKNNIRLIHAGYGNFGKQHDATEELLNDLKIPHVFHQGPHRPHAWTSGWLPEMVSALVDADIK